MRVITGTARGRRLASREGLETRPTPERVKEAIFNIVQFQVEGRCVLDAFAGSGQLGIEALSRGAVHADFLDVSRESVEIIKRNLNTTGLAARASVYQADALAFLRGKKAVYDLCFLDPPYRTGLLQEAMPLCVKALKPTGILVCEHPTDEVLPDECGAFCRLKDYRYGKIALTTYAQKDEEV